MKESLSGITSTGSSSTSNGPNVGAIVGGVIGGVVGISIIAFLIWKFVLKGRRHEVEPEQEYFDDEDEIAPEKLQGPGSFLRMREAGSSRASTHTVASLASTVLTRASNIIQIAYIPGVTNRNTLQSPGLLVPPVPPVPIPTTPSTLNSAYGPNGEEQRFFVPELRDSQAFSDTSSLAARTDADGLSRKSVASSLARSTIYRDSAVVNPMPATTIVRGRPAIVSVKSGSSSNTTPMDSPAIGAAGTPTTDLNRHTSGASSAGSARPIMIKMPSSSDSVRPSQFGSQHSVKSIASTLASARSVKPITLNILKKNKAPTSAPVEESKPEEDEKDLETPKATGLGLQRVSEVPSTHSPDTPTTSSPHARALRESHAEDTEHTDDDDDDHERSRQSLLNKREEMKSPFEDENEASTPTPRRTEFPKEFMSPKKD